MSDVNDLQMAGKYDRLQELVKNPILIKVPEEEPQADSGVTVKPPEWDDETSQRVMNAQIKNIGKEIEPEKPVIEFYNMGDLCKQKVSMKFHATGFMEEKAGLMISGAGGLGKSFVSMNIALELAKKQKPLVNGDEMNLFDSTLFDLFPIPRTCTSLFIQSENNLNTTNMRLNKMAGECPDCRDALQRIFMPKINEDCLMSGLTLDNEEFPQYILDLIHMIEDQTSDKLDILWVDPIISYISCDENHSVDVRRHLDVLTRIANEADVTPAIIHHGKKDDSGFRGTSAFRDWCRSHIELKRAWTSEERLVKETGQREEDPEVRRQASVPLIKVHHEKSNNFREFEDFSLRQRHDLTFAVADTTLPPEKVEAGHLLAEIINDTRDKQFIGINQFAKTYAELSGKSERQGKRDISDAVKNGFIDLEKSRSDKNLPLHIYKLHNNK